MAPRVLDRYLDSKDTRRRLAPHAKPYFRTIERGLHLGYRRLANGAAGPWIARHYRGEGRYEEEPIGHADDLSDADGVAIMTYWQAVESARARMRLRVQSAAGIVGPYTVADAVAAYLEFLQHNRNTAYDVRKRMEAHALPQLGKLEVASLTADRLRKWHAGLARKPPRLRSKLGGEQKYRILAPQDLEFQKSFPGVVISRKGSASAQSRTDRKKYSEVDRRRERRQHGRRQTNELVDLAKGLEE